MKLTTVSSQSVKCGERFSTEITRLIFPINLMLSLVLVEITFIISFILTGSTRIARILTWCVLRIDMSSHTTFLWKFPITKFALIIPVLSMHTFDMTWQASGVKKCLGAKVTCKYFTAGRISMGFLEFNEKTI